MTKYHTIEFPGTEYAPLRLEEGADLPSLLTPENSPILFGCRNGICATCLSEVVADGEIAAPAEDEADTLELVAEGNPKARLVCQLKLCADLKIKKIDPS